MYDSKLERDFHKTWNKHHKLPLTPQHKFHPRRKWRFDFAHIPQQIGIEIQGYGVGHASYDSMHKDYMKHNEAVRLGWRLIYIMSVDLVPKKVEKTMAYIHAIITGTSVPTPPMSTYDQIIRKFEL